MPTIVMNVLISAYALLALFGEVLFHLTPLVAPQPCAGEGWRVRQLRLLAAYSAIWRAVLASPIFWGSAGFITAALFFVHMRAAAR